MWGFNAMAWLMLLATVLNLAGCITLARDDRPRAFAWRRFMLRWSLQVLPAFGMAGALVEVLEYTLMPMPSPAMQSVSAVMSLPLLLCPTITFIRLRQLALRLNRRRLAEHIGIVAAGAGASLLLMVVAVAFVSDHIRRADAVFYAFVVLPVALVALFNLWALLMLFVITPAFFNSARQAAARWRAADAARVGV